MFEPQLLDISATAYAITLLAPARATSHFSLSITSSLLSSSYAPLVLSLATILKHHRVANVRHFTHKKEELSYRSSCHPVILGIVRVTPTEHYNGGGTTNKTAQPK